MIILLNLRQIPPPKKIKKNKKIDHNYKYKYCLCKLSNIDGLTRERDVVVGGGGGWWWGGGGEEPAGPDRKLEPITCRPVLCGLCVCIPGWGGLGSLHIAPVLTHDRHQVIQRHDHDAEVARRLQELVQPGACAVARRQWQESATRGVIY